MKSSSGLEQKGFKLNDGFWQRVTQSCCHEASLLCSPVAVALHTPPAAPLALRKGTQGRCPRLCRGTGTAPGWNAPPQQPITGVCPMPSRTQPLTCLALPTQKVMEWKWMKRPCRG